MRFKFVAIGSPEYKQGLLVRELLFFKDFINAQELLKDTHEEASIHLVALNKQQVVGTGRLTLVDQLGIVSQMTVLPSFQNKQVGKQILLLLLDKAKESSCTSIELSARITALEFYKKYDFMPIDKEYLSKKTGVLHRNMVLNLNL